MWRAHNLAWKLALVASGQASDALLDTYGSERRPVAEGILKLTHALFRYGTMSHPVKRQIRDVVVPALARSAAIQRRATRRLTHTGVAYPPGPLVRAGSGGGRPGPGQRMPDIAVCAGGRAVTLHSVLRGGQHVLVVPAASAAHVLDDAGLGPCPSTATASCARFAGAQHLADDIQVEPDPAVSG